LASSYGRNGESVYYCSRQATESTKEEVLLMLPSSISRDSNWLSYFLISFRFVYIRLEKIAKAEQQLAGGKKLDDEQMLLLSKKADIDKSVNDLAQLRIQLEEVSKQVLTS
jgi:hypothetical protein